MKKFGKKLMALTMVGVLMCTPLTAFATEVDEESAAQGDITGTGDVEGIVNKDVFKVVLPTVAAGATTFNFILDPQGLIKDTNGSKYTNATFDAAAKGLYFANPQDGGSTKYMASSPALTATNKGTVAVDVTLTATADADSLKDADKGYTIGLAADDTFANDKTTSVYLALVSGSQTAALTANGATITDTLAAAPSNAYEVTYNTTSSKYEYGLTTAAQAADYTGFKSLNFNLTGACNTAADWAVAEDAAPSVEVTWTLEKHVEMPITDGTTDVVITYKGAKPANGSITVNAPKGNSFTPAAAVYADKILLTDSTITFKAAWLAGLKSNAANGVGIYTFKINNKTYSFNLVDKIISTPTSDGSTDIVIAYTGAKPATGTITVNAPKGNSFTPAAAVYTDKILLTDSTITFKAVWLAGLKSNASNGSGTYTFTINGTSYSFIVE